MHLHDSLDDRQADAEAATRAPAGAIGLAEHVEDTRQHFRMDAHAAVPDAHHGVAALASDRDRDRLVRLAVLGAVVQEVGEYLGQPRAIGVDEHGAGRLVQREAIAEQRRARFDGVVDRQLKVDRRAPHFDLAGRDASDVEQVVDEPDHLVDLPLHDFERD